MLFTRFPVFYTMCPLLCMRHFLLRVTRIPSNPLLLLRRFFASTHGDHTVKITDFSRSKVVQTLRGHPRTPWTVKFHPKDSRIVASGCLASEVKDCTVFFVVCMLLEWCGKKWS